MMISAAFWLSAGGCALAVVTSLRDQLQAEELREELDVHVALLGIGCELVSYCAVPEVERDRRAGAADELVAVKFAEVLKVKGIVVDNLGEVDGGDLGKRCCRRSSSCEFELVDARLAAVVVVRLGAVARNRFVALGAWPEDCSGSRLCWRR